jgi:hypothetical protein
MLRQFKPVVTDDAGQVPPEFADLGDSVHIDAGTLRTPPAAIGDGYDFFPVEDGYRGSQKWIRKLYPYEPGDAWYYESKRGLISVYDNMSHRQTKWLGPEGFASVDAPPAKRFEGEMLVGRMYARGTPFLLFTSAIYSLTRKSITQVFRAPDGERIADAQPMYLIRQGAVRAAPTPLTLVTTNARAYLLDSTNAVVFSAPHPGVSEKMSLTAWRLPALGDRMVLWFAPPMSSEDSVSTVVEYDPSGGRPLATHTVRGRPFEPDLRIDERVSQLITYGGGGETVFPMAVGMATGASYVSSIELEGPMLAEDGTPVSRWRFLPYWLALVVVSAALTWVIGRRYAFSSSRLMAWIAASVVIGPFAVILMWLTEHWPARERCAACGKMRVVNREMCEHCGAAFAAPEPDGTEVFA